jgi:hypothetical protein
MKTLPKYFAIKRDESNPLWNKYIEWLNSLTSQPDYWKGDANGYYGIDGNSIAVSNGTGYHTKLEHFVNPVEIITLEYWYEHFLGSDMLQEGDYFEGGTVEQYRDLLIISDDSTYESYCEICFEQKGIIYNGTSLWALGTGEKLLNQLTFEEFKRRAINTFKPEIMDKENPTTSNSRELEFDPSKTFEVTNDGKTWLKSDVFEFIGFHDGKPVVWWTIGNMYVKYDQIRNIPEEFNACQC